MTQFHSSFSGVRMVADDAVATSTFIATRQINACIVGASRTRNIFGTGISVGGIHRLDKFILKR